MFTLQTSFKPASSTGGGGSKIRVSTGIEVTANSKKENSLRLLSQLYPRIGSLDAIIHTPGIDVYTVHCTL
jgi:hypothetical protein